MRICFVVDYRSPIARNWIAYIVERGHEVHVISTYPGADALPGVASVEVHPLGFSGVATHPRFRQFLAVRSSHSSTGGPAAAGRTARGRGLRRLGPLASDVATWMLVWLTPLEARVRSRAVAARIRQIRPSVVHAMRIPCEGMLAAEALMGSDIPLVTSVWGNDFTLWAPRSPIIAHATRRALQRTSALHTDCFRDLRLSERLGWDARRPAVVLPGSGGVQLDIFGPGDVAPGVRERWGVPPGRPVIVNPRSFRPSYVRNDTFFASIPIVLQQRPDAIFLGVGMAGHPVAEAWRRRPEVGDAIRLLPNLTRSEMADIFRLASITVSPSMHDGTPNTLLEAMACGTFPIAGDIESVREWITSGENGLLCDPGDARALASAILRAVGDPALRARAAAANRALVAERAEYGAIMRRAEAFYDRVAASVPPVRTPPDRAHSASRRRSSATTEAPLTAGD